MKLATLLTAVSTLALAALAPAALAQPTYTLDGSTLTVEGAEVAFVRATEPGVPEPDMITREAFWDQQVGFSVNAQPMQWVVAPATYAVRAWAPADADGRRDEVSWEIVVDGPAPLTRPEQIRLALFGLIDAVTRWRTLGPTDAELFAAVRAGPLAHPTPAVPAPTR